MITQAQISKALREIEKNLLSGDSIQVARMKACGHDCQPLSKMVRQTEAYLILLNYYQSKIKYGPLYERCPVTKKLKAMRKK